MRRGFTLLELIIVIIIIGILATLGFTQYSKMVEKGRTAEARMILGTIRTAQEAYILEHPAGYTATIGDLPLDVPTACDTNHYFSYSIDAVKGTATRCTGGAGKGGNTATSYTVTLDYATGTFTGL